MEKENKVLNDSIFTRILVVILVSYRYAPMQKSFTPHHMAQLFYDKKNHSTEWENTSMCIFLYLFDVCLAKQEYTSFSY